jgi:hypothetical protein
MAPLAADPSPVPDRGESEVEQNRPARFDLASFGLPGVCLESTSLLFQEAKANTDNVAAIVFESECKSIKERSFHEE